MQHAGVHPGLGRREGALEDLAALDGVGALGRLPGREVPHLPRRDVHQGLGEERRDVEVVRERWYAVRIAAACPSHQPGSPSAASVTG